MIDDVPEWIDDHPGRRDRDEEPVAACPRAAEGARAGADPQPVPEVGAGPRRSLAPMQKRVEGRSRRLRLVRCGCPQLGDRDARLRAEPEATAHVVIALLLCMKCEATSGSPSRKSRTAHQAVTPRTSKCALDRPGCLQRRARLGGWHRTRPARPSLGALSRSLRRATPPLAPSRVGTAVPDESEHAVAEVDQPFYPRVVADPGFEPVKPSSLKPLREPAICTAPRPLLSWHHDGALEVRVEQRRKRFGVPEKFALAEKAGDVDVGRRDEAAHEFHVLLGHARGVSQAACPRA